jgi:hypothetical protein
MDQKQYRDVVEECIEFGWLNQDQDAEFRRIERDVLLPGLAELREAQQILASMFLQREYIEPGVALAPSPLPWPAYGSGAELPQPLMSAFEAADGGRGRMALIQSASDQTRRRAATAVAQEAARRGWLVLRAVGRTLQDGRRDPVYERLVTEGLLALDADARSELCLHRGQYLQLMAPLDLFPVRPGGVFNTDPGLNRTKLNAAFQELLLRLSDTRGVCLLAEEAQVFPALVREALAYLAWTLKSGTMGLTGLGTEDRVLAQSRVLLLVTCVPPDTQELRAWAELLGQRRVPLLDLDGSRPQGGVPDASEPHAK